MNQKRLERVISLMQKKNLRQILVTESGCEVLNRYSKELTVV